MHRLGSSPGRGRTTAQGWGSPIVPIRKCFPSTEHTDVVWTPPDPPSNLPSASPTLVAVSALSHYASMPWQFHQFFCWFLAGSVCHTAWAASITTAGLWYRKRSAQGHWSHKDDGSEAGLRKGPTASTPKAEIDKPGQQHTAWETLPSLSSFADKTSKESMHKIHSLLLHRRVD